MSRDASRAEICSQATSYTKSMISKSRGSKAWDEPMMAVFIEKQLDFSTPVVRVKIVCVRCETASACAKPYQNSTPLAGTVAFDGTFFCVEAIVL